MLDIELIAKAIRSMSGRAEGEVQGAFAQRLKDMTGSQEPLHSTVTVLKRFRQFECARVQIDVTQEKVPSKFGTFHTFHMPPLGLNICTDGNPPDGRLEKVARRQLQDLARDVAAIEGTKCIRLVAISLLPC
jgi:hypothetical protein